MVRMGGEAVVMDWRRWRRGSPGADIVRVKYLEKRARLCKGAQVTFARRGTSRESMRSTFRVYSKSSSGKLRHLF